MPQQYPSDRLEVPGAEGLNVGTAREFLEEYTPKDAQDAELLVIAQGLRKLLHGQVDRNKYGSTILLEEEHERRRVDSEAFLKMPRVNFPAEDAAQAAEVARRNAAVAAEINGPSTK